MGRIGHDPDLGPEQRDGVRAQLLQGEGKQRRGDLLARGKEHIKLPLVRQR